MVKENKNYAFVDGQNLYMGTSKREVDPWRIDLARFRVYLEKKYNVDKAYYFLGFVQDENQDLYEEIQNAGFILQFKKHNPAMLGTKKGNVDTDIVFHIMKKLYKKEPFDSTIKRLFLIELFHYVKNNIGIYVPLFSTEHCWIVLLEL